MGFLLGIAQYVLRANHFVYITSQRYNITVVVFQINEKILWIWFLTVLFFYTPHKMAMTMEKTHLLITNYFNQK